MKLGFDEVKEDFVYIMDSIKEGEELNEYEVAAIEEMREEIDTYVSDFVEDMDMSHFLFGSFTYDPETYIWNELSTIARINEECAR